MKSFLRLVLPLLFISILSFEKAFSQVSFESEEQLVVQANKLFLDADYVNAMPLFSQLLSLHPKEANYNYKFGVCLLHNDEDKAKSLLYFDFAVKESAVDKEAFFYAGKGYQTNARFDEALAFYEKYKAKAANPDPLNADRFIQQCKNGKNLYDKNVTLQALEKTETLENEFYRNYDLKAMKGRIIPKPLNFKSKKDVKLEDNTLIFVGTENQSIVYSGYNDDGLNTSRELFRVNKLPNGEWAAPLNIGEPVNTIFDEEFAFLHPEGKTLYFSSKGHNTMGGYDIFRSVFDETTGKWSAPVNLAHPINSPDDDIFYASDDEETFAYFASKNFTKPGKIKVNKISTSGVTQTNLPVIIKGNFSVNSERVYTKAEIKVIDKNTNALVGTFNSNRKTGNYLLMLPAGKNYVLNITPEDFVSHRVELPVPAKANQEFFEQKINFQKDAVGETVTLTNFFDATGKTVANNLRSILLNEQLVLKAKTENKKILNTDEFANYKTQKAEEEKLHADAQKKLVAEIESNQQETLLNMEAEKKVAQEAKLKTELDAIAKVEADKKAAEEAKLKAAQEEKRKADEKLKVEQEAVAKAETEKKAEKAKQEQLAAMEKQKAELAEAKQQDVAVETNQKIKLVNDSLTAEQTAAYEKMQKEKEQSLKAVEEQKKKDAELKEQQAKADAAAQEKFLAEKASIEKVQKEKDELNRQMIEEQKLKEQQASAEIASKNKAVMDSIAQAKNKSQKVANADSLAASNEAKRVHQMGEQERLKAEREKLEQAMVQQEELKRQKELLQANLDEKRRLMEEAKRQQEKMNRIGDSLAIAAKQKEQAVAVVDETEKIKMIEAAAQAEAQRKASELKAAEEKRKSAEEAKLKAEQDEKRKVEEQQFLVEKEKVEEAAKLKAEQEKYLALEKQKKQEEKNTTAITETKPVIVENADETSEQLKLRLLIERMNAEQRGREIVENNLKAQQQSGNDALANAQRYKEVVTYKQTVAVKKKEEKIRPPFDKTDLLSHQGVIYKLELKLPPVQLPDDIVALLKPGTGASEEPVYYSSGAYITLAEATLDRNEFGYKGFAAGIVAYLNGKEINIIEAKKQPVVE